MVLVNAFYVNTPRMLAHTLARLTVLMAPEHGEELLHGQRGRRFITRTHLSHADTTYFSSVAGPKSVPWMGATIEGSKKGFQV